MFRFILIILILAGCSSTPTEKYQSVHLGMDKGQVLERMGNPRSTRRKLGVDMWHYKVRKDNGKFRRVALHFYNGELVYKGKPLKPPISPEEKDRIRAEADDEHRNFKKKFKPVSDKKLRKLIKKEMKETSKKKKKKKENFEPL